MRIEHAGVQLKPSARVMSDTNVQGGGGAAPPGSGPYGSGLSASGPLSGSGLGHLHHGIGLGVGDTLSFGLGFFPDPDMNSKSLPPFSSFGGEGDGLSEGLSGRLLDLGGGGGPPPWDLYGEGLSARLIDVGAPTPLGLGIGVGVGLGLGFAPPPPTAVPASVASSVANGPPGSIQYRPWESKNNNSLLGENGGPTLLELGRMATPTPGIPPFTEMFPSLHGPSPKLPSFQSQFQAFQTSPGTGPAGGAPAPADPGAFHGQGQGIPPAPGPGATTQGQGHVNNGGPRYSSVPTLTTLQPLRPEGQVLAPAPHLHHGHPGQPLGQFAPDQRHIPQNYANQVNNFNGAVNSDGVLHVTQGQHGMHPHHTPSSAGYPRINGSMSSPAVKIEMDDSRSPFSSQGSNGHPASRGTPNDGRKKEKRKYRASSLESSESDASMCGAADAQVPAVSSTAPPHCGDSMAMRPGPGFKHPVSMGGPGPGSESGDGSANGDKQTKKKRKRCGECIGCMRKDNCASCAPCRNDKSHQICKMRRCEKLTEKKVKVSVCASGRQGRHHFQPTGVSGFHSSAYWWQLINE